MPLWLAVLLLLIALGGISLAYRYLPPNSIVQMILIICCALAAIACTIYIALTVIFISAVSSTPPAP